jgi:hypothetical protein
MNDIIVAYGGGTNSTAMPCLMLQPGLKPGLILFSDTGGERPETYRTVETVSRWCLSVGFPEIQVVRYRNKDGQVISLEQDCLTRKALPSLAYGWKTCSDRWKIRPQQKAIREYMRFHELSAVQQFIGYDADEERRMRKNPLEFIANRYPLIENSIYREDCVRICRDFGLPATKSARFFCPSSKKKEIMDLQITHPDLLRRAVEMENNADLMTIQGLGRKFSWKSVVEGLKGDDSPPEQDCGCYDG